MGKYDPAFLQERSAAAFLDMKPAEFRDLVSKGSLPGPVKFDRWDKDQLAAIMRGEPAKQRPEFDI